MGNSSSKLFTDELEQLHRDGLNYGSIKTLHSRFLELAKQRDDEEGQHYMTKADFEAIPDLLRNPLGSRLIDVFFVDAEVAKQGRVYFRDFVKVLAIFDRSTNTIRTHQTVERLNFAFTMYDLNRSGTVTKDEFTEILIRMIGGNVAREKVEAIAERTMREADRNADGSITFEEFCRAMEKQTLKTR